MTDLKSLGRSYNAIAKGNEFPVGREMTQQEQDEMLEALRSIVDTSDLHIEFVDVSPYQTEYDLRRDVIVNKRFRTPMLSCPGIMDDLVYTLYRMMHDIRNHVLQHKSFSPFDELLSAYDLTKELDGKVSQYTIDFIFTDVLLFNSVYAYNRRSWSTLKNGENHKICCFSTWNASSMLVPSKA